MNDPSRVRARLTFPIRLLAQHVEAQPDGKAEIRNLLTLPLGERQCLPVFTSREKADGFARRIGAFHAQIGMFERVEDFAGYLEMIKVVVSHVTVDPAVDVSEMEIGAEVEEITSVIEALRRGG